MLVEYYFALTYPNKGVAMMQSPAQVKYLTSGFTRVLSLNWVTTLGFISMRAGAVIPKILTTALTKAEIVSPNRSHIEEK